MGNVAGTLAPFFLRMILVAVCTAVWTAGQARAMEIVRINGSGGPLGMVGLLAEAYTERHREVRIETGKPLGSSGAVQALLAGRLDLVVSSKPLTSGQAAQGLRLHGFGTTPLVVVTERAVPQKDITTAELEDIYTGRLRQWPNGERIRVVLRPWEDVDSQILRGLSRGMNDALNKSRTLEGVLFAATDPESDAAVSRTPGAIGTAALVSVISGRQPLNILSLDGVKGSLQSLAHGNYPLAKQIHFVTTAHPSPAVQKFLVFVYSRQGRAIAEKTGVLVAVGEKGRP